MITAYFIENENLDEEGIMAYILSTSPNFDRTNQEIQLHCQLYPSIEGTELVWEPSNVLTHILCSDGLHEPVYQEECIPCALIKNSIIAYYVEFSNIECDLDSKAANSIS